MYDVVLTGWLRWIDANGAYLASSDANKQTLTDCAKSLVRQVAVSINGNEKMNFNKAGNYWSVLEQLEEDNEDESMSYYIKCDEARQVSADLTSAEIDSGAQFLAANVVDEKDLCKWEIYCERQQWARKLGFKPIAGDETVSGYDRTVLYSARQHFIIPGHEIPAFALGKIDFWFDFDSSGLIVFPGLKQDATNCWIKIDDIQIQTYYVEPTEDQKDAYRQMISAGSVSFPYRVIASKTDTLTDTVYDSDIQVPSSVICMCLFTFVNKGTIKAQDKNSRELDLTGGSG